MPEKTPTQLLTHTLETQIEEITKALHHMEQSLADNPITDPLVIKNPWTLHIDIEEEIASKIKSLAISSQRPMSVIVNKMLTETIKEKEAKDGKSIVPLDVRKKIYGLRRKGIRALNKTSLENTFKKLRVTLENLKKTKDSLMQD